MVAIGETGLDHFRTGPDGRGAQEESFRRHIALAKALGKTVVIHDRDAHDDVVRVLLDEGAPDRVVFHCFSGGAELAAQCAEHGWFMSFAGPVTFKANDHLREALSVAPADLLLVETDAPFLAPLALPRTPQRVVPDPGDAAGDGAGQGSRRRGAGRRCLGQHRTGLRRLVADRAPELSLAGVSLNLRFTLLAGD